MLLRALLESAGADTHHADDRFPCLTLDADLWFSEVPGDVERAKGLCWDCPARNECLDGAVERREPAGVWGGELFVAGVVVPFKRPRGRPPKSASSLATAVTRVVARHGGTGRCTSRRVRLSLTTVEVSS
jgi:WhiB family redox-sensing transcriptional regulator